MRIRRQPPDKSVRRRVASANAKDHEILVRRPSSRVLHLGSASSRRRPLARRTLVKALTRDGRAMTSFKNVATRNGRATVQRQASLTARLHHVTKPASFETLRVRGVYRLSALCGALLRRVGGQMRAATRPDATSRRFARVVPRASISLVSSFCCSCVHTVLLRYAIETNKD